MPPSEAQPDRRYIAILCGVALLILVTGVWFRPARTPPPVPSELETLSMQMSRQRLEYERRHLFYSRMASDLAKTAADVRVHPDSVPFRMRQPGETVVLLAPDSGDQPVWVTTQTAGMTTTVCGEILVQEIATPIHIPSTLANAVAFDLDDNLAGLVIDCGTRAMLTTPPGFQAWTAERKLEKSLEECCGLQVTKELKVVTIRPEAMLAKRGVRPGDWIVAVAGQPVASRADLHETLTDSPPPEELTFRRGQRTRKIALPKPEVAP